MSIIDDIISDPSTSSPDALPIVLFPCQFIPYVDSVQQQIPWIGV
jgi:hypothetical protein